MNIEPTCLGKADARVLLQSTRTALSGREDIEICSEATVSVTPKGPITLGINSNTPSIQAELTATARKRNTEGSLANHVVNEMNVAEVQLADQGLNQTDLAFPFPIPPWLNKIFHPTSNGFALIKWILQMELHRSRPPIGLWSLNNNNHTRS